MTRTTHPDFNRAKPEKRWIGGSLFTLWNVLNAELMLEPNNGRAVYRILPEGALVALARNADRRAVRIARSALPASPDGVAKFEKEVDTFAKHFGTQNWERKWVNRERGIAITLWEPKR